LANIGKFDPRVSFGDGGENYPPKIYDISCWVDIAFYLLNFYPCFKLSMFESGKMPNANAKCPEPIKEIPPEVTVNSHLSIIYPLSVSLVLAAPIS